MLVGNCVDEYDDVALIAHYGAILPRGDVPSYCEASDPLFSMGIGWLARSARAKLAAPVRTRYMFSIRAEPNSLHLTSFAPSIRRAKS